VIPRRPIVLDPVFDDPGPIAALFDELAPYPMLQARGQVMSSHLEQAAITGAPITETMLEGAYGDARASLPLRPTFRGYWATAQDVPDAVAPLFGHERFVSAAQRLHGASVVRPTEIYAHLIVPHREGALGSHVDLPSFRGIGRRDLPVWMLVTMRRSGLFERWRVPVATAVCWFYSGPGGSYTYWPDGPDAPPRTTQPPFDNTGIVGENDTMFHRGDPMGRGDVDTPADLALDSALGPAPGDPARWQICNGERVIAAYAREDVRFALSWSADVFRDEAAERLALEHRDDLALGAVIDTFLADLEQRGVSCPRPADPLHDPAWIALLARTYRIVPRIDPLRQDAA
jgi:hypothetical protein